MSIESDKIPWNREKPESLDLRRKEWESAHMWVLELVKSVTSMLMDHPMLFGELMRLNVSCNNKNLENWTWIYKDYPLSWKTLCPRLLTLPSDLSAWIKIDFTSKDQDVLKLLFANKHFLLRLINDWFAFDANKKARHLINWISSLMCTWVDITPSSTSTLAEGIRFAKKNWKKVVFLANHLSHLDAPILDFILSKKLNLQWLDPRFVCWAYMYYNRSVRPYTTWFNTLFIYWPDDIENLKSRLTKENWVSSRFETVRMLKLYKETLIKSFSMNPDKESLVLFPYAWRAKNSDWENYPFWCKSKILPWMEDMLTLDDCVYIPLGTFWTDDFFGSEGKWWWGNVIRNFSHVKPQRVVISIWDHFVWGSKDLDQIHQAVLSASKRAYYWEYCMHRRHYS